MIHRQLLLSRVLYKTSLSALVQVKAKSTIGFIGLGNMGKSMARNILSAHKASRIEAAGVMVYDISMDHIKDLVAEGAIGASSLQEIGRSCDIIITMVRGGLIWLCGIYIVLYDSRSQPRSMSRVY
jgi:NADH/NAD ratio-sensing transcriptional regulator Rex